MQVNSHPAPLDSGLEFDLDNARAICPISAEQDLDLAWMLILGASSPLSDLKLQVNPPREERLL